jgi:hypothetical protein
MAAYAKDIRSGAETGRTGSRSPPSSTSASAARTWAHAFCGTRCGRWSRPSTCASSPISTRATWPRPWPGWIPETTLVVVVSKTFTTQETLANADLAKAWLAESLSPRDGQASDRRHRRAGQGQGLGLRPHLRLPRLGRRPLFAVVGGQPVGRRGPGLGRVRAGAGRRPGHGRAFRPGRWRRTPRPAGPGPGLERRGADRPPAPSPPTPTACAACPPSCSSWRWNRTASGCSATARP